MSLILNIDTAGATAYINIAADGNILHEAINKDQKDHAAFLQPAVQSLIKKTGIGMHAIDAIAVAYGPGSYTGLRVAMASAKGLSFALNKPLITVGSLEILALSGVLQQQQEQDIQHILLCPMIDARRMEVFTGLYDSNLQTILPVSAIILEEGSFSNELLNHRIAFFGNGAAKWKAICKHEHSIFWNIDANGLAMSKLTLEKFESKNFADVAYAEPLYIKEFYMGPNA